MNYDFFVFEICVLIKLLHIMFKIFECDFDIDEQSSK